MQHLRAAPALSPAGLRVPLELGTGAPIVLLHGFAMTPVTYRRTAQLLSRRARVLVPDLFATPGRWHAGAVVDALVSALDARGIRRATFIGHSFGGGIELRLAARHPDRVSELVFSDTLAVSEQWSLADEALRHPVGLRGLVTAQAVGAFARSWARRPLHLAEAAWWGFRSRRDHDIERVAAAGLRSHVLWANRDSILSRSDGERFAELLHASFTVASSPDGPVDHDWMFQDPELFVAHVESLGLEAFS